MSSSIIVTSNKLVITIDFGHKLQSRLNVMENLLTLFENNTMMVLNSIQTRSSTMRGLWWQRIRINNSPFICARQVIWIPLYVPIYVEPAQRGPYVVVIFKFNAVDEQKTKKKGLVHVFTFSSTVRRKALFIAQDLEQSPSTSLPKDGSDSIHHK